MRLSSIAVAILILISFLTGCSSVQKINSLKPEPDDAKPITYKSTYSFIKLPVTLQLKDVQSQTNRIFNGLIYEDTIITDDDIQMKVWKLAPVSITDEKGKIKTVLPLRAQVKYRIGTDKLGVSLYNVREFNLSGNVTVISDVQLRNWKLNTVSKLRSLEWNESPSTTILGKQVPITYIINPTLRYFKADIEKSIDDAISESIDFKPMVLDALQTVSEPFQISETYETWLRVIPTELYTTEAVLKNDKISLDMGMKCQIQTLIGRKPASQFDREKIVLKPVSKMPDRISANIAAVSTYIDASKILTNNFAGEEFGSGNKKVKVIKVALWHKSGKMVIALDLIGSLQGTVYLTGYPQYNSQTKEIYFDQLDYAVETKSAVMRTANWLASGFILNKIKENCRYSIAPNLAEARQNMVEYLQNYSPTEGVFVNGTVGEIEFDKMELGNKAIIAFLKIDGEVRITVDGLK